MNKIAIATAIGIGAGLALVGAYRFAPYAGFHPTPALVMVVVAIFAFGSSVAVLVFSALNKPEKKPVKPSKRLSRLGKDDYAHFPTSGVQIVLRPDSAIEELDVVRHPSSYAKSDIFLKIKKARGKAVFNPILIKRLFEALEDFGGFLHVILVSEHDEYVGYLPAAYARVNLVGKDAESQISKYIVDVLANPTDSSRLTEINGLPFKATISEDETVSGALKKISGGLFRGLVVFRDSRNRKPVGVIYAEDLIKLSMPSGD
jgi:hypothetical protein